jgi:hypothetical protein
MVLSVGCGRSTRAPVRLAVLPERTSGACKPRSGTHPISRPHASGHAPQGELTITGTLLLLVVPLPSWPFRFAPQQ